MTFPGHGIQVSRMCSYRWQAGVSHRHHQHGPAHGRSAYVWLYGGLATVDVGDFAGNPGVHSGSPAGVLDGQ